MYLKKERVKDARGSVSNMVDSAKYVQKKLEEIQKHADGEVYMGFEGPEIRDLSSAITLLSGVIDSAHLARLNLLSMLTEDRVQDEKPWPGSEAEDAVNEAADLPELVEAS